jgi:hypothetical protein
MRVFAQLLVAAGRGPARIPTCEVTLRHARTKGFHVVNGRRQCSDWTSVVLRALSLFGPGELRGLCVHDNTIVRLVSRMLQALPDGSPPTSQVAQALNSLRVLEIASSDDSDFGSNGGSDDDDLQAAAIIERCAATLMELKGPLLCKFEDPSVLRRCTPFEVLTRAPCYDPAAWLGSSQLHTLCGVDLGWVSITAIAAALPRLHTLKAYRRHTANGNAAAVFGFFTDLLLRLRVFHFEGVWWTPDEAKGGAKFGRPRPLPLLEELVLVQCSPESLLFHGFLGARPRRLRVSSDLIVDCLPSNAAPECSLFLSRVCELHVFDGTRFARFSVSDVAQVLRAAPQLRTFRADPDLFRADSDPSWLTAQTCPLDSAFKNLVHPRLRHFASCTLCHHCVSRLWQTSFPGLRVMVVCGETFFAPSLGTG